MTHKYNIAQRCHSCNAYVVTHFHKTIPCPDCGGSLCLATMFPGMWPKGIHIGLFGYVLYVERVKHYKQLVFGISRFHEIYTTI